MTQPGVPVFTSFPSRLPLSDAVRRSSRRAPRPTHAPDLVCHAIATICRAETVDGVLAPLVGSLLELLPVTCAAVVTLDGPRVEVDRFAPARGGARVALEIEHQGAAVRAAAERGELTPLAGGRLLVLGIDVAARRAVALVADPERPPIDDPDRTRAAALAGVTRQALATLEPDTSDGGALQETILLAIAHELRTPLTAVRGSAEVLAARWRDLSDAHRDRLLTTLAHTSSRLDHLLHDLLDLTRLDTSGRRGQATAERTEVDLDALLTGALAGQAESSTHQVDVVPSGIRAAVDRVSVERIVVNLVANAIRHTPPGTTVTVAATAVEDGVELHVSDDGPGIAESDRDRIFAPFERGAGPLVGPGTGIGLSLVARFAELHGGSARVEPAEEGGARFVAHLPAPVRIASPAASRR